mgnify:CR=1 FL=1
MRQRHRGFQGKLVTAHRAQRQLEIELRQQLRRRVARPRGKVVGEGGVRTDEDVVLQRDAVPQLDAALDRDAVAHDDLVLDEAMGADIAVAADDRTG